jgi:hypothetical protein
MDMNKTKLTDTIFERRQTTRKQSTLLRRQISDKQKRFFIRKLPDTEWQQKIG